MTREEFGKLRTEVFGFMQESNFKDQSSRYIDYRKKLMVFFRDESLDESLRREAYGMQEQLKATFHAVIGAYDKRQNAQLKNYPELEKYGKEIKLAENFEFKPKPLALGIKHYYAQVQS